MMLILVFGFVLALFFYNQVFLPYIYWQKKKIPHLKPWPVVGNMIGNFLATRSFGQIIQDMYEKFPDQRYFGFHHYAKPTIMLRDPDLIKQICVTDFDAFTDHPQFLPEDTDPLVNSTLLLLKGKQWQTQRAALSPAFTTNKLKEIFPLVMESSNTFVSHYFEDQNVIKINVRDFFSRFTSDIAASFALGVKLDSVKDKENEIYMIGKRTMTNESSLTYLKYFGYAAFPAIMRLLKVTFVKERDIQFLKKEIYETLRLRRTGDLNRVDLIQALLECDKQTKIEQRKVNDEEIFAQAVGLFLGAFDTPLNLLAVIAYELAINQDVQDKLIKEIDETFQGCREELSYQAILNMKYMNMVVSETMRLWPVTTFTDRLCVKPYVIQPKSENETALQVDVGTYVWLPIYALHRDSRNFPNPTKFDPERFSDGNKEKIRPYTFIPFGVGPRGCVASRLALLECKVIIFSILSKLRIVTVEETEVPIILSTKGVNIISDSGPVLGLRTRKM